MNRYATDLIWTISCRIDCRLKREGKRRGEERGEEKRRGEGRREEERREEERRGEEKRGEERRGEERKEEERRGEERRGAVCLPLWLSRCLKRPPPPLPSPSSCLSPTLLHCQPPADPRFQTQDPRSLFERLALNRTTLYNSVVHCITTTLQCNSVVHCIRCFLSIHLYPSTSHNARN